MGLLLFLFLLSASIQRTIFKVNIHQVQGPQKDEPNFTLIRNHPNQNPGKSYHL